MNHKQFIEYTKEGDPTEFTVTVAEPRKRWGFDLENGNVSGHWTGIFPSDGKEPRIGFSERVTA